MNDSLNRGWRQAGPKSYDHHCGARVSLRRGQLWTARTVNGNLSAGHTSAEQACQWIEAHDPDFWTYGHLASGGNFAGISFHSGSLDSEGKDWVVVCSLPDKIEFPPHLKMTFKRHFLGSATCARCGERAAEIMLRLLANHSWSKKRRIPYVVCSCGYPVWRISEGACFAAERAILGSERYRMRKESIREAGGKHTIKEIQDILALQGNRCIYCNILFTGRIRRTRDHIMPVAEYGTDWAFNIVMACQPCNSRRGTIPFRTYCKLLSPTQNRRILTHMARRLLALDVAGQPADQFEYLKTGIKNHDPRHGRYRHILSISPLARRNESANQLIPSKLHLIVRKAPDLYSESKAGGPRPCLRTMPSLRGSIRQSWKTGIKRLEPEV
jgi:5-methylcytosine-specific restriction endonuclease McrA